MSTNYYLVVVYFRVVLQLIVIRTLKTANVNLAFIAKKVINASIRKVKQSFETCYIYDANLTNISTRAFLINRYVNTSTI